MAVRHINDKLVAEYGQEPIIYYVTLNEPNMLVLNTYMNRHFPGGGKAAFCRHGGLQSPAGSHVRAYNAIHDIYEESAGRLPR